MKTRSPFAWWCSLVPLAGFVYLIVYALLAYWQVGHWPSYGQPDPKAVGSHSIGYVLMGGLLAFIWASPVALAILLWVGSRRELAALTGKARTQSLALLGGQVVVFGFGAMVFFNGLWHMRGWLLD